MSTARVGEGRVDAEPPDAERHLRADAQRNRERVLEAADTLLATRGVDVSVDEIAHLAQVGVGTLYRNFPTKGALLEALLEARIAPLLAEAREAASADDPGEAFVSFVRRMSDEFANFKALADAMVASGVDLDVAKRKISGELLATVGVLFQRAGRGLPAARRDAQRCLGDDDRSGTRGSHVYASVAARPLRCAGV
jgi:AcrR family transcriptional regulator